LARNLSAIRKRNAAPAAFSDKSRMDVGAAARALIIRAAMQFKSVLGRWPSLVWVDRATGGENRATGPTHFHPFI
jgi:hypothetical protein